MDIMHFIAVAMGSWDGGMRSKIAKLKMRQ
jgi:hypothetical protein